MISDGRHGGEKCHGEESSESRLCDEPLCCTIYGDPCVHEYKIGGKAYSKCVRDCEEPEDRQGWCPTATDSDGNGSKWQRCHLGCSLSRELPIYLPSDLAV